MSKITNDVRLNPIWHRILYSCTHMATVGIKWLISRDKKFSYQFSVLFWINS